MSGHPPHSPSAASPLILWIISDGKPGHANQALGLSRAIEARCRCETHLIPLGSSVRAWIDFLRRRTALGRDRPGPHLILGVGHRTHPAMLAARAGRGGRTIVLMRPTLPLAWFDLVVIPKHDAPKPRANVIPTRGVITPIQPSDRHEPGRGLILLGGPSRHVEWSDETIVDQIAQIVRAEPAVEWRLTTSRRTPAGTPAALEAIDAPNLTIIPAARTPAGWVAEQLALSSRVWVSEDSVSMVYEAVTAGARVGLLRVPGRRNSRVSAGLHDLLARAMVTPFERWRETGELPRPAEPLDEAGRCADRIVHDWLPRWGIESPRIDPDQAER